MTQTFLRRGKNVLAGFLYIQLQLLAYIIALQSWDLAITSYIKTMPHVKKRNDTTILIMGIFGFKLPQCCNNIE